MWKDSSARYYKINKERIQKRTCERYQDFLKKKENSDSMVASNENPKDEKQKNGWVKKKNKTWKNENISQKKSVLKIIDWWF